MHRDDLLTEVRIRARLYGRNHAARVVRAVMHALRNVLPEPAYLGLVSQLPTEVAVTPAGRRDVRPDRAALQLIREVADELHVSEPDAAFYTRTTLEQLNAFCRGTTPAQLAASLPADLRPLLSARADDPAQRHRHLVRTLSSSLATLSLKGPPPGDLADRPAVVISRRTSPAGQQKRHHAA
ncbi:DUF2267 domain-containing protein [Actinoplanes auranticolor]|uniref:DUF2267 domain-containing protein n=1 Tax=Actinoplanes auranticolor TaxID=47988 RepID=A0A919VJD8_9ACTN|nr:DUF2267 domain-containing protein [Actinoplanes auranticolor]GIM65168.1 hypothetical protein Aau02nite_15200 [Actinoplanes auranticolor]